MRRVLGAVALLGLVACTAPLPTDAPATPEALLSLHDASPACPPGVGLHLVSVPGGTRGDVNGNGLVCVRNEGPDEVPSFAAYDDAPEVSP